MRFPWRGERDRQMITVITGDITQLTVDAIGPLITGFGVALQPINLALAFGGVFIGTLVGMLPGIGPINAIALLVPFVDRQAVLAWRCP